MNKILKFHIGQKVNIPFAGEKDKWQWLRSKDDPRFEHLISGEVVAIHDNKSRITSTSLAAVVAWKDKDFRNKICPEAINEGNGVFVNNLSSQYDRLDELKKDGYSLYYPINSYEEVYSDMSSYSRTSILPVLLGSALSSILLTKPALANTSRRLINENF